MEKRKEPNKSKLTRAVLRLRTVLSSIHTSDVKRLHNPLLTVQMVCKVIGLTELCQRNTLGSGLQYCMKFGCLHMHLNRPHELREVGVGGAGGEANGLGGRIS